MISEPATALDTLARKELRIDPEGLGGLAWVAAATSFLPFAGGALVPVLPHLVMDGVSAVVASGLLSAVGLVVIGLGA